MGQNNPSVSPSHTDDLIDEHARLEAQIGKYKFPCDELNGLKRRRLAIKKQLDSLGALVGGSVPKRTKQERPRHARPRLAVVHATA